jgi:hypothetical protein
VKTRKLENHTGGWRSLLTAEGRKELVSDFAEWDGNRSKGLQFFTLWISEYALRKLFVNKAGYQARKERRRPGNNCFLLLLGIAIC